MLQTPDFSPLHKVAVIDDEGDVRASYADYLEDLGLEPVDVEGPLECEISDSHGVMGTALERLQDFARKLGLEIYGLRVDRTLPASSIEVARFQIEVNNMEKLRNLEILARQVTPLATSTPAAGGKVSGYLGPDEAVANDRNLALEVNEKGRVYFSAYLPQEVFIGHRYGIYLYAHLASALSMVQEDIKGLEGKLGGRIPERKSARNAALLLHGAPLTVEPICTGLTFQPTARTRTWGGDFCRFDFEFEPAGDLAARGRSRIPAGNRSIAIRR